MIVRTGNASNALKSSCHMWNLIHWEAARRTGCFLGSTAQHKIQKDNSLDQVIGELAGWAIQILPNKHNRVFCFQPLKTHQGVLFSAPAGAQTDGAKIIIVSHCVQNIDIAPPSTGSREASATPTDSEPGVIKPGTTTTCHLSMAPFISWISWHRARAFSTTMRVSTARGGTPNYICSRSNLSAT